jgi:hypothetical protein
MNSKRHLCIALSVEITFIRSCTTLSSTVVLCQGRVLSLCSTFFDITPILTQPEMAIQSGV